MNEPMNPYKAPQAKVADIDAGEGGLERASRGRRLAGAAIDGLVGGIVMGVLANVTGLFSASMTGDPGVLTPFLMGLMGFAAFLAIHGWLLVTRGQTVGKLILGMRIVHPDGSRVNAQRLLGLRYGVPMLFGLAPVVGPIVYLVNILWIFGSQRRCLHDLLANTIVIKI